MSGKWDTVISYERGAVRANESFFFPTHMAKRETSFRSCVAQPSIARTQNTHLTPRMCVLNPNTGGAAPPETYTTCITVHADAVMGSRHNDCE